MATATEGTSIKKGNIIMSQRAEYITRMETQLGKLNEKMSSLEAGAQEAKEEARQTYKE